MKLYHVTGHVTLNTLQSCLEAGRPAWKVLITTVIFRLQTFVYIPCISQV